MSTSTPSAPSTCTRIYCGRADVLFALGVTLYRVRGHAINDGEFIPLDKPSRPEIAPRGPTVVCA